MQPTAKQKTSASSSSPPALAGPYTVIATSGPAGCSREDVVAAFRRFGRLFGDGIRYPPKRSDTRVFIDFATLQGAQRAIEKLHGSTVHMGIKPHEWRLSFNQETKCKLAAAGVAFSDAQTAAFHVPTRVPAGTKVYGGKNQPLLIIPPSSTPLPAAKVKPHPPVPKRERISSPETYSDSSSSSSAGSESSSSSASDSDESDSSARRVKSVTSQDKSNPGAKIGERRPAQPDVNPISLKRPRPDSDPPNTAPPPRLIGMARLADALGVSNSPSIEMDKAETLLSNEKLRPRNLLTRKTKPEPKKSAFSLDEVLSPEPSVLPTQAETAQSSVGTGIVEAEIMDGVLVSTASSRLAGAVKLLATCCLSYTKNFRPGSLATCYTLPPIISEDNLLDTGLAPLIEQRMRLPTRAACSTPTFTWLNSQQQSSSVFPPRVVADMNSLIFLNFDFLLPTLPSQYFPTVDIDDRPELKNFEPQSSDGASGSEANDCVSVSDDRKVFLGADH